MPINRHQISKFWHPAAEILLGAAALAFLTLVGLWLDLNLATASLAYVIVVVLLCLRGSLVPAVALSIIAAVCLDYFFTVPRFSIRIDAPEDAMAVAAFATTSFVITGLVRRARRLGEAAALKDRLQVIIDTIPAVVWSHSPDGAANFLNKRFRDYAGLSAEEGRGWAWMNALHPEDGAMDDWRAALALGEPFEREARLRRADGEYRRFLLRFVPLRDERGSVVEWYATSTDIEDLKRTEEELRRREARLRDAQMQLAHANRVTATGQLAASIAHEVSQPIAAALTNANAAWRWLGAEPPDLEEVRQALGRIISARIILGLLFLTFGLNGFLHFIPMPPPSGLAGQYFGVLFVSHYLVAVFLLQAIAGALLLTNRYVAVALVLLGPILVNILLFHCLMAPEGLPMALVATALWLTVFFSARRAFSGIFAARVNA